MAVNKPFGYTNIFSTTSYAGPKGFMKSGITGAVLEYRIQFGSAGNQCRIWIGIGCGIWNGSPSPSFRTGLGSICGAVDGPGNAARAVGSPIKSRLQTGLVQQSCITLWQPLNPVAIFKPFLAQQFELAAAVEHDDKITQPVEQKRIRFYCNTQGFKSQA